MSTMSQHQAVITLLPPTLFTIPEAAWVAEIDQCSVRNDIKKKVVIKHESKSVFLDRCDMSYLRAVRNFHRSIDVKLRRQICAQIRDALKRDAGYARVYLDPFELPLFTILREIDERIYDVHEARRIVEHRDNVRGGEPVIVGTRIPARLIGDMIKNGATVDEIVVEYNLGPRQVELAALYSKLHPRMGRPSADQPDEWSDLGDLERGEVEELGELRRS